MSASGPRPPRERLRRTPHGPVPLLRRAARDRRDRGGVPSRGVHDRVRAARRPPPGHAARAHDRSLLRAHGRRRAGLLPHLGVPAVPADGRGGVRRPRRATAALVRPSPPVADLPRVLGGVRRHHALRRDLDAHRGRPQHPRVLLPRAPLRHGHRDRERAARVPRARGHLAVVDARGGVELLSLPAPLRRAHAPARGRPRSATRACGSSSGCWCCSTRSASAGARSCTGVCRTTRRSASSATTGCPPTSTCSRSAWDSPWCAPGPTRAASPSPSSSGSAGSTGCGGSPPRCASRPCRSGSGCRPGSCSSTA